MKHLSIKSKIAVFYTLLLTVVLLVTLTGAMYLAHSYTVRDIQEELQDEVKDLRDLLEHHPEMIREGTASDFYDDGIILSLYTEDGEMVAGVVSEDFPEEFGFQEGAVHAVRIAGQRWYAYDDMLKVGEQTFWIRGICPYNLVDGMVVNLAGDLVMLVPLWILLILAMGYWMIRRLLTPVSELTHTAAKISNSQDLSARLPEMKSRDELAELTDTFNSMLDHLEQVLRSEKRFTSDAAHELRTPISVIISHCEYCLEDFELSEELREELTIIHRKAVDLSELVTKLLAIARAENNRVLVEMEPMDLGLLVEMVLEELQEQADGKQISLCFDNQAGEAVMEGDQNLLTQMFINLAENSIKYGKTGGQTRVTLAREGDTLCLAIADDGIGIPEESLDRIWDRFYRVESGRSTEGMGLGLFMVRWTVQRHGGTVSVSSRLGEGTTFTVRLPVRQE